MIVHKYEFIIIILYHVRLRIHFVKLNVAWPNLLYIWLCHVGVRHLESVHCKSNIYFSDPSG